MSQQTVARRPVPAPLLGMILFVASEAMFFGALISAFFAIGGGGSLHDGREIEVVVPLAITALLLLSSATAHAAQQAAGRGEGARAGRLLLVTMGLGIAFLGGQAIEYRGLGFGLAEDASTTLFYTLTGFHGLHVLAGVLMLGAARYRASKQDERRPLGGRVEAVVLYWHFVDVIWLGLVASLYLLH